MIPTLRVDHLVVLDALLPKFVIGIEMMGMYQMPTAPQTVNRTGRNQETLVRTPVQEKGGAAQVALEVREEGRITMMGMVPILNPQEEQEIRVELQLSRLNSLDQQSP